MSKLSTLIYHEWAELFEEMAPEDVKTVILALLRYDSTGEKQDVAFQNKLVNAIYKMMLEKTENNRTVYFGRCEQNRINGALGGAPKGNKNAAKQPKTTENNPKQPDRKGVEGKGEDRIGGEGSVSGKDSATHTPSLSEVVSFCQEEDLRAIDPERFWNYYESQKWMIDGSPLEDWKARARFWNSQDKPKVTEFNNFHQRKYDFKSLEKELLAK